ncbi:MAG: DUF5685 family protein [Christensenellales bacterium]
MFGYIRPYKPELKIKEYELFRAHYCGVCLSASRRCSQPVRLALSYDCAFLATVISSAGTPYEIKARGCIANPFKKKPVAFGESVDFAADINAILAYHKLRDDRLDGRTAIASAAMLAMRRGYKKAAARRPDADAAIIKRLDELWRLEKAGCSEPDEVAECFGRMLEDVVSIGLPDNVAAADLAFNMGRWIYLIDALDDFDEDAEKRQYNVLGKKFTDRGSAFEGIRFNLETSLGMAGEALAKMEPDNEGLLGNIIYLGSGSIMQTVANGRQLPKNRHSE